MVVHEFRAPVQIIIGLANLLDKKNIDEQTKTMLIGKIQRGAAQLMELSDLLSLEGSSKEELQQNAEQINLEQTNSVYYKIVADTNAYYLSPETVMKYGKKRIKELFLSFKRKIEQECEKKYGSGKVKIVLFTELIRDYKEIYEKTFTMIVASVLAYVSQDEFQSIKQYLQEHIGFKDGMELDQFTTRVIASYIAEGVVIPQIFTDPIWINYDEPPCLSAMTNRLNGKKVKIIKNYKKEENIGGNK